jgi:hydrophobic/amphiphilic exporter-1 (mainly G- bacteria), HAE1 family
MIYSQAGGDINTTTTQSTTATNENVANIKVFLKNEYASFTDEAIKTTETYLNTIPDIGITFSQEESALQTSLGTNQAPFVVEVKGKDYSEIEKVINESKAVLLNNSGLYNITTSLDQGTPEIEVAIDRFKTSY